jgi:hypothetical protein
MQEYRRDHDPVTEKFNPWMRAKAASPALRHRSI